ncbi:MAG: DUF21 domain-containing protein, partial [Saprospiraceae bacterium]|nr:DUF21 domain-containing protein [Saprospiraceae bacterium]
MDFDPPSELLYLSLHFVLQMSGQLSFLLISFVTLLMCSGLISASEVAFFSLDVNEVKALENEKSERSRKILALKEKPRYLLAVILISNNLVNTGIILMAATKIKLLLSNGECRIEGEW